MQLTAIFRVKFHHQNYYKYAVLTLKREGDFLFWYRRMGFWQYISCYDSIKDALAESPEAVLSYRNIKIGTKEREISAPYKESDLKSKPAFYNREAFWMCLGSFLIAASLLTGLLLIHFISFLSIFMLVPAILGTLVIMKGEDDYVWR